MILELSPTYRSYVGRGVARDSKGILHKLRGISPVNNKIEVTTTSPNDVDALLKLSGREMHRFSNFISWQLSRNGYTLIREYVEVQNIQMQKIKNICTQRSFRHTQMLKILNIRGIVKLPNDLTYSQLKRRMRVIKQFDEWFGFDTPKTDNLHRLFLNEHVPSKNGVMIQLIGGDIKAYRAVEAYVQYQVGYFKEFTDFWVSKGRKTRDLQDTFKVSVVNILPRGSNSILPSFYRISSRFKVIRYFKQIMKIYNESGVLVNLRTEEEREHFFTLS